MQMSRLRSAALLAAATFGLSACVYDGYGSSISIGYGSGYYDDAYYDPYYGGSSYYGWYDDYYYPGNGYYVYDRFRRPYRWNDYQRRYWTDRGRYWHGSRDPRWDGFSRHLRREEHEFRQHARDERRAFRRGEMTPEQFREHRREERRAFRQHRRSHRRGGY